jgi:hypothetical protein
MLNKRPVTPPDTSDQERNLPPGSAMANAKEVRDEYKRLEIAHRDGLYRFFGMALGSYRQFLVDPVSCSQLLNEDNIKDLPQKPALKKTSRLLLYYHTGAHDDAGRTIAGKYARVVDYLHKEGIADTDAAEYVKKARGLEGMLNIARGHKAPKAADETRQDDDWDVDQGEQPRLIPLSQVALDVVCRRS